MNERQEKAHLRTVAACLTPVSATHRIATLCSTPLTSASQAADVFARIRDASAGQTHPAFARILEIADAANLHAEVEWAENGSPTTAFISFANEISTTVSAELSFFDFKIVVKKIAKEIQDEAERSAVEYLVDEDDYLNAIKILLEGDNLDGESHEQLREIERIVTQ